MKVDLSHFFRPEEAIPLILNPIITYRMLSECDCVQSLKINAHISMVLQPFPMNMLMYVQKLILLTFRTLHIARQSTR